MFRWLNRTKRQKPANKCVRKSLISLKSVTVWDFRKPFLVKVFDADEFQHLVISSLDFWLTTGMFAERFETDLT
jgi:hypothetical protein